MQPILLVGVGGGVGAVARYLVGAAWLRAAGPGQPYLATFAINVAGGLLMGVLVGALAQRGGSERLRLLLGVGGLGGFTTFSAFSLEAVLLLQRRAYGPAFAYMAGSVVCSMAALWLGLILARRIAA